MADLQSVTYGETTYTIPVGGDHVELTQAEYDALTQEEKNNGTVYFVTDGQSGGGSAARNYTTTERKVGTYLGKDLYEITLTNISVPKGSFQKYSTYDLTAEKGISVDWTIVGLEGFAVDENRRFPIPFSFGSVYESSANPPTTNYSIGIQGSSTAWLLFNAIDRNITVKTLTLRYVKEVL